MLIPVRCCTRFLLRHSPPFGCDTRLAAQHRLFSSQQKRSANRNRGSFFSRLRAALNDTPIEWYYISFGTGIGVVGLVQLRKLWLRSRASDGDETSISSGVRPMGPWQVQILSTLPLRAISYYWGVFNEIPLPSFLRVPGFKLYSWIFGVNLEEVEHPLSHYRNLAEFFYRRLKPGSRPVDGHYNVVVSPADGKILQFGEVRAGGQVEQVKGMTYSLDVLLGAQDANTSDQAEAVRRLEHGSLGVAPNGTGKGNGNVDQNMGVYSADQEFANVNGISYTLPSLLSGSGKSPQPAIEARDASLKPAPGETAEVRSDLSKSSSWWSSGLVEQNKRLFFAVVYLAPGDYHRFHSPVSWVVERRRHFAGELYSVSPFLQNRLPNLFTLNERVVLLGRWRHGMFSMTLVGATNVGSIKIHFDRELRTNSFIKTVEPGKKASGFTEATYAGASALLEGYPIAKGSEMGGFNLGSTVVLVFEAPGGSSKGEFRFRVHQGQQVRMGEALGVLQEEPRRSS